MRRREFVVLACGAACTFPSFAFAQNTKRIGLMANLPLSPAQRFRERLEQLGWVEGKNLTVEYRYGEGRDDRFPEFAAELVSMRVDVIVVWGNETGRLLLPSAPLARFRF